MNNIVNFVEQQKARAMIHVFLRDNSEYEAGKNLIRIFFHRILFMQKRIKDKLVCKDSKVDVLLNYWEKVEFQIMTGAAPSAAKGRPMDEESQNFAMKLHRVPMEVRMAVLTEFT